MAERSSDEWNVDHRSVIMLKACKAHVMDRGSIHGTQNVGTESGGIKPVTWGPDIPGAGGRTLAPAQSVGRAAHV